MRQKRRSYGRQGRFARPVAVHLWLALFLNITGCAAEVDTAGTVVVDCSSTSALERFSDESLRQALLRHLSASAKWRVTKEGTGIVARQDAPRSYSLRPQPRLQWGEQFNVILRFAGTDSDETTVHADRHSEARAGAAEVNVRLNPRPDGSKTYGSVLVIKSKPLTLQIVEWNQGRDRTLTREALKALADELIAVADNAESVSREGYVQSQLPEVSLRESADEPPMEIGEGIQDGIFMIRGYINPGEFGYTTIRAFDADTGTGIEASRNENETLEYVGWSSSPRKRFFFESEFTVFGGGIEKRIRFELWFHGRQERKLLETTRTVKTWRR